MRNEKDGNFRNPRKPRSIGCGDGDIGRFESAATYEMLWEYFNILTTCAQKLTINQAVEFILLFLSVNFLNDYFPKNVL